MHLSDHFTLEEAVHSQTAARAGIDNEHPSSEVIIVATKTAKSMERVRALLQFPISVSSWIRCLALNRLLGSKDTSQHRLGEAVDFICPAYGTPVDICKMIIKYPELVSFDQLILEHTWVHISFSADPSRKNRNQVLSLLENGAYTSGLADKKGKPL